MPDNQPTSSETTTTVEIIEDLSPEQLEQVAEQSEAFIGQWNTLISTSNWEKGEIICGWRAKLRDEDAPVAAWSDERWSQMVGGVTPQHVGRMRRTFERFGHVYQEFKLIYWSHFYAALDWDDAEMWLEGSVQNKWSVSEMRNERWKTLGELPGNRPADSDIVVVESAEEAQSLSIAEPVNKDGREFTEGPNYDEGPDFGEDEKQSSGPSEYLDEQATESSGTKGDGVKPFEAFTKLPKDVAEAADAFKISIIRNRADEWSEISKEDMLGLLDALKHLVMAE